MACKWVSSGVEGTVSSSLEPIVARISSVAVSTSFSSASNESYAPFWTRLAIVEPAGGVSLARFASGSPEVARVAAEVMGRVSIDGWGS